MTPSVPRLALTALLFAVIIAAGFALSRGAKPYPTLLFTLHKLIALGAAVLLGIIVQRAQQAAPLQAAQIAVVVLTAVFLVAAIITGGLVSAAKTAPIFAVKLHQILPYLTVVSAGALVYLVFFANGRFAPAS